MAATLFYGWTAAELLVELKKAQRDLLSGQTLQSSGSGDLNASAQIQRTAKERILEIQQALYELDPETYADFATIGYNQTEVRFSESATSEE